MAVATLSADDARLVEGLRRGEEAAFSTLLDRYHNTLQRLARFYVPSQALAEEVVQETWLGVLQGIGRFEGRSSLKTWVFQILLNRARTKGERESRHIPFSAFADPAADPDEPAVEPERFLSASDPQFPQPWAVAPKSWGASAEQQLLAKEARSYIQKAIKALPPSQREVITLRDVEGWSSDEVCNALGLSETNQRVLLHRARSKVRRALEDYFEKGPKAPR
ncbi:MAG: RNA polymerase sigma factor [Acidobacteria bacterium]|nr:RNA polymerase sigma factor [Acidobacteriota bacterium]